MLCRAQRLLSKIQRLTVHALRLPDFPTRHLHFVALKMMIWISRSSFDNLSLHCSLKKVISRLMVSS